MKIYRQISYDEDTIVLQFPVADLDAAIMHREESELVAKRQFLAAFMNYAKICDPKMFELLKSLALTITIEFIEAGKKSIEISQEEKQKTKQAIEKELAELYTVLGEDSFNQICNTPLE